MAEADVPTLTEDFIAIGWDDDYDSPDEQASAPTSSHAVGQPPLFTKGRKRTADEMEAESSYNKKQRIAAESRVTPWAAAVDWDNCRTAADMLNQEVDAFVDYISPTPEENEARTMTVQWIQRTIVSEFPDAEVVPFGSFATQLYLPTGDIDLVVISPSVKTSDTKSTLYRLAYILRSSNITDHVEVLAKTKVPIIKFVTSHGRFPVDISINQPNGIRAVDIVNGFIKELPAAKPLVLIVKSFLNQRSMNEVFTGGLGSYSIVCMVTSFLQMHPKIRRSAIDPMENLGVLLVEFFETYGRFFQFDQVGISLRNGGHYFDKKLQGWSNPGSPGMLTIEDPQDPMNDVSGGSYGFMRVRHTLQGAFEVLSAALCLRGSALFERRHDSYDGRSSDEMSLLGSIMGVTPETISKRKLAKELYTSGVLHRLLGLPAPVLNGNTSKSRNSSLGVDGYRSRDASYTRYASQSRSRSPSPRSKHRQQRSFSPPGRSRKKRNQPVRVSDYNLDRTLEEGKRRKRRKGRAESRRDPTMPLHEDSEDMWAEASRGAREILQVDHGESSSYHSSEPEDGQIPGSSSRDDQSEGPGGGRYAIMNSRPKHQLGRKFKGNISSELIATYVGDSDDSDSAHKGKAPAKAAAEPYLAGDTSMNSATTAEMETVQLDIRHKEQRGAHSSDALASFNSNNMYSTPKPLVDRLSETGKRRAFWSAKSGFRSPDKGSEDSGAESSGGRRK